jgi:beta-lactamase regulating signal transducer with metallopeptidase domain
MLARVDLLADFLLRSSVSALLLSMVATLAMIATRQPGRRLVIARAAMAALLCIAPLSALELVPRASVLEVLEPILPPSPSSAPVEPREARQETAVVRWEPVFLAFYAAGLLWGVGGLAVGLIGSAWLKRHAEQAEAPVLGLRDELANLARIRPPDVRFSRRISRPILIGSRRPCIILPSALDREANSSVLRLVILHECCHLRGCDPCFSLLAHVTRTVWFLLPTVWWICAQMRLDQEFLADRFASEVFGPDFSYAKSLVDLAEPGGASRRGGGGRALLPRILMLVRCPFALEKSPPFWWRLAMVPGISVVAILALSLTPGRVSSAVTGANQRLADRSSHGSFQLERLTFRAEPGVGSPQTLTLPVVLPEEFDLSIEVLTTLADLPRFRIAGCALSVPRPESITGAAERWLLVRLARRGGTVAASVDSKPVQCDFERVGRSERLTLRSPAGRSAAFQSLRLSW